MQEMISDEERNRPTCSPWLHARLAEQLGLSPRSSGRVGGLSPGAERTRRSVKGARLSGRDNRKQNSDPSSYRGSGGVPKSGVKFAVFMRICPKIGICARNLCSTRSDLVWVTQSPSGFNLCTRRKIFSPSRARKGELNSRSVGRFCGRVSSPGSQKSLCRSLLNVKVCHS